MRLFDEYLKNKLPFSRHAYSGERIDCPVCGGKSQLISRIDRSWKRLSTDACLDCGLFFTNPMPTEAELRDYYRVMYRATYINAVTEVPEYHVRKKNKDAERRAELIMGLLEGRTSKRTLDFGCGIGLLVGELERRGCDAHGFEPGDVWSKHTGNDKIIHGNWHDINYAEKSFDFVSIIHVLEHLRSPLAALQKVETLLKDDGIIWIEVPDMQAYETKTFKRFHFAHVLGFSSANLIAAAFKCGFFPIKTFPKEAIGKMRAQVSVVFRKRRPQDVLDVDLKGTASKNIRDYTRFNPF